MTRASEASVTRVLIVDDSPDDRMVARRYILLAWPDAEIQEEQTAEDGLDRALAMEPDVVLVDHHLPGHDGLWFIQELRTRVDPGPAVVMLTGSGDDENAVNALSFGAEDYLLKDQIRPDALRLAVRNAVLRRRMQVARLRLAARVRALQRFTRALLEARGARDVDEVVGRLGPGVVPFDRHTLWVAMDGALQHVVDGDGAPDAAVARVFESRKLEQENDRWVVSLGESGVIDLRGVDDDEELETRDLLLALAEPLAQALTLGRYLAFERQLLGIASHDLRAPLFTVTMSAALLKEDASLTDTHRQIAARMERAAFSASRMVGDLLDFTRGELADGIPVEPTPTDIDALLDEVVEGARARAPKRSFEVRCRDLPEARVDKDRVQQALTNLVENAVKFGDPKRPITVAAERDGGTLVLSVHNHGAPIAPRSQQRIFEANVQEETKKKREGLGLGLYIVRRIAQAHGGSTEVESSQDGGTRFAIRLPSAL